MEGGRGKSGQIILSGLELLRLPRMWEGLGVVQFGVAEHLLELGVIEGAVGGGVNSVAGRGGRRLDPWGGWDGAQGGGDDLPQGGIEVVRWGPWGEQRES